MRVLFRNGGSEFHNLEAVYKKGPSFRPVLDLGIDKRPFEDDLSE